MVVDGGTAAVPGDLVVVQGHKVFLVPGERVVKLEGWFFAWRWGRLVPGGLGDFSGC